MSVIFINNHNWWDGLTAVAVRVNTFKEFSSIKSILKSPKWVFRGHKDKAWKLCPSIERCADTNLKTCREFDQIQEFKELGGTLIQQSATLIDCYALMQHYGIPTRLLDFTRDLAVAAYFAFEQDAEYERAIWALDLESAVRESEILQECIEDDTCNVATKVGLTKEEFDALKDEFNEEAVFDINEFAKRTRSVADEALKRGIVSCETGILPVILPTDICPRMNVQDGLFVMTTGEDSFSQTLAKIIGASSQFSFSQEMAFSVFENNCLCNSSLRLIKFILDKSFTDSIRSWLAAERYVPSRIYPDLAGIADIFLRNYGL